MVSMLYFCNTLAIENVPTPSMLDAIIGTPCHVAGFSTQCLNVKLRSKFTLRLLDNVERLGFSNTSLKSNLISVSILIKILMH